MIASSGEKIGLRIVAEHADIWHVYGSQDYMRQKIEVLERYCAELGRNARDIQYATEYIPGADQVPNGIRAYCANCYNGERVCSGPDEYPAFGHRPPAAPGKSAVACESSTWC